MAGQQAVVVRAGERGAAGDDLVKEEHGVRLGGGQSGGGKGGQRE